MDGGGPGSLPGSLRDSLLRTQLGSLLEEEDDGGSVSSRLELRALGGSGRSRAASGSAVAAAAHTLHASEAAAMPSHPPLVRRASSYSESTRRARDALRRAARKAVLATAIARPMSAKGVPLMRSTTLARAFKAAGLHDDGAANGAGTAAGAGGAAHRLPSESSLDMAARFVRDALAGRSPNTRLAAAAGLAGGGGGGASAQPAQGGKRRLSAARCRLEDVVFSRWFKWLLQLLVIVHCVLSYFENIPPSTSTPPFSWWPGGVEVALLLVYTLDQVIIFREFGLPHYRDKRWEAVFAVLTAALWLDWALYYPVGLRALFRFARPLRPILGVAKRKSLRRLLASVLRTIPHMLDVAILLFVTQMAFGSVALQLFNEQQVPGYDPNDDNFNTWAAAALAMFEARSAGVPPTVRRLRTRPSTHARPPPPPHRSLFPRSRMPLPHAPPALAPALALALLAVAVARS